MNKCGLRAEYIEKRKKLTALETEEMSRGIVSFVQSLEEYRAAETVAAYYPVNGEADTRELFCGKTVALPVCTGKNISFYAEYEKLEAGAFGIPKPCGGHYVPPEEIDFIIVPAVVLGRNFHRIGYGGGFYDRFLPKTGKRCIKCGIGYDFQLIENIKAERCDIPLNIIVTNKEIIKNEKK